VPHLAPTRLSPLFFLLFSEPELWLVNGLLLIPFPLARAAQGAARGKTDRPQLPPPLPEEG
jgi:hypothetical protein